MRGGHHMYMCMHMHMCMSTCMCMCMCMCMSMSPHEDRLTDLFPTYMLTPMTVTTAT